ncbi:thioredoxin family protein, partial [Staphylococcus aureus]|uniref:thioredoxin family protein n=1 Tax=Staphylococcus aureus TaxID=1280 RepID=UPI0037DA4B95
MNLPILKHITQPLNLQLPLFHTHHHTKLIHQYLTNPKSPPIPIFLFFNHQFQQQTVSPPRANQLQKFLTHLPPHKLPTKHHPHYPHLQKQTHLLISNPYKTHPSFSKPLY